MRMTRTALIGMLLSVAAFAGSLKADDTTDSLVVAAVSCEAKIRNTKHNLERIAYWSKQAADRGADLVLFPECTIHGWWQSRENRNYAETIDGESIAAVTEIARKHRLRIAVGLTEERDGRYYLSHAIVGPQGVIGVHRKSSLAGGENGEAKVWDRGNDANVFDVGSFKVGIAICFESVHAETCRKLNAGGAEVILAPYSNGTLPEEILDPQHTQRKWIWERVRENRVWYIACDATPHGKEGDLLPGAAFAIDPDGKLVACTPKDTPGEAMIVVRVRKPAKQTQK